MRGKLMAPKDDCPKCGNWYNGRYGSVWKGPKLIAYDDSHENRYDEYLEWKCSTCGYTIQTECLDNEEKNTR